MQEGESTVRNGESSSSPPAPFLTPTKDSLLRSACLAPSKCRIHYPMPEYERLDAEGTALPSGAIYALGLTPGRETWGLEPWDLGDLTPDWLEYVEIERPWFYALPRSRHTWEDGSRPLRRRPWFDTFINLIFVGAVLQLGHLLLTAFMECGGHQKAVGSALFPGGGGVAHGGEDATSYNFDHTITPTFDEAWYGTTPGKCASWCSPRHMTSHCARSDCFGCGFCLDSPPPYAPPPRPPPQTPPPAPPPAPGALPDPGLCVGLLSGVHGNLIARRGEAHALRLGACLRRHHSGCL